MLTFKNNKKQLKNECSQRIYFFSSYENNSEKLVNRKKK
jgi:hypothetical protein